MIRQARLGDLSDLMRLARVLGYPAADAAAFKKLLETLLERPEHLVLVADIEGKVHGFVEAGLYSTLCVFSTYEVLGLVVDTEFQNQGLGGQLIEAFEAEVKSRGIRQIKLNSGEKRLLAHEFYEKHGYIMDHLQKKFTKKLV